MKLHNNIKFFTETIRAASEHLEIKEEFVEKDYWITLVLNQLSKSKYADITVFKGGTSLSKGFGLIDRFSEDVDLAIIDAETLSGNKIKEIIRAVEKEATQGLEEINTEGVTSKGSRFRRSLFTYKSIDSKNKNNKLIVEVNSFANPFPYEKMPVKSMAFDFLMEANNAAYIEEYDLQPFEINILRKEQTLIEKLVSLVRFSFADNEVESISGKIRHFYDLHFLKNDEQCSGFIESMEFKKQFDELLKHDKEIFDEPEGWNTKNLIDSPLVKDFNNIWGKIKSKYEQELSGLAYRAIPDEKVVARSFIEIMNLIK